MSLHIDVLTGERLRAVLDDLAQLRISVFREFPYLYDGTVEYERQYLSSYSNSAEAILVAAFDGARLVGAATGTPMEDHASEFADAMTMAGLAIGSVFYFAESVLQADYRGRGVGHRFFDLREAHARELGRQHSTFCAVVRPPNHPMRPASYLSLEPFWRARGYTRLPGVMARFSWKDVDVAEKSEKVLQFWGRQL